MAVWIEGDDEEGRLVLVDGKLAAVVARLHDESHPAEHRGRWHLEASFGPCAPSNRETLFASLADVRRWVERCLADALPPALAVN
jgi:hypothetical protein